MDADEPLSKSDCTNCGGSGVGSRRTVTSKTTGSVRLRYSPREPVACECMRTIPENLLHNQLNYAAGLGIPAEALAADSSVGSSYSAAVGSSYSPAWLSRFRSDINADMKSKNNSAKTKGSWNGQSSG